MQTGSASFATTDAFGGFLGLDGRRFRTRLPPHVHATYVIGVIDAGTLQVSVPGGEFVATPGSVLVLPPFTVHRELPLSGEWSFRYLYPSEQVVRHGLGLPQSFADTALAAPRPVLHDAALAGEVRRIHTLLLGGRTGPVQDLLVRLLQGIRSAHCEVRRSGREGTSRARLYAVRDLLIREPRGRISLQDMASEAGLSRFRFAHLFREAFGVPPYTFYEQVRIAYAHQLIEQGVELSQVAFRLGFSDQSHFTRQFKRGSFTTPGRFAMLSRRRGVRDSSPPRATDPRYETPAPPG